MLILNQYSVISVMIIIMIISQATVIRKLAIITLFIMILCSQKGSASRNALTVLNDCTCLGHNLTFQCVVTGRGSTIWQGSAFNCSSGIQLRHTLFQSGSPTGECNGGTIIAQGISASDLHCYTSQLIVSVTPSLNRKMIACVYDNGVNATFVGNYEVTITTAPYPPPNDVHISRVGLRFVTFSWSAVLGNCSTLVYQIMATNCGICPRSTTHTSVTCTSVYTGSQICSFRVQTDICDNIRGTASHPILATLAVPAAPQLHITPQYSYLTGNLTKIYIIFNESDTFNISDKIDGSATSYTINFMESGSGRLCDSTTIAATSCQSNKCSYTSEVLYTSCPSSTDIFVTVFATNVLGDGSLSQAVKIDVHNNFVKLKVDLASSSIICEFLQDSNDTKECSIIYGHGEDCDDLSLNSQLESSTHKIIRVGLPGLIYHKPSTYCFVATASSASFVATVKGTFRTACNPASLSDGTHPSNGVSCDTLHSVGIKDGIGCYTGTDIGSIVFYSCFNCGISTFKQSMVRICREDGFWNGSIPSCDCIENSSTGGLKFTTYILVIVLTNVLFIILTVVLITAIVALAKTKATLQKKLKVNEDIYEEVDVHPPASVVMVTDENVAYAV